MTNIPKSDPDDEIRSLVINTMRQIEGGAEPLDIAELNELLPPPYLREYLERRERISRQEALDGLRAHLDGLLGPPRPIRTFGTVINLDERRYSSVESAAAAAPLGSSLEIDLELDRFTVAGAGVDVALRCLGRDENDLLRFEVTTSALPGSEQTRRRLILDTYRVDDEGHEDRLGSVRVAPGETAALRECDAVEIVLVPVGLERDDASGEGEH